MVVTMAQAGTDMTSHHHNPPINKIVPAAAQTQAPAWQLKLNKQHLQPASTRNYHPPALAEIVLLVTGIPPTTTTHHPAPSCQNPNITSCVGF